MAEASLTMFDTKGIIWVTISNINRMMTKMVSIANSQSGA